MTMKRILKRAWFNGRTRASQARDGGSIPLARSILLRPSALKLRWGFVGIMLIAFLSGCATAPKKELKLLAEKRVPGATYHTVRRGDTLWSISRAYGVHLQDLIKANPILYTNATIENGQCLLIPCETAEQPKVCQTVTRPVLGETFVWPVRGALIAPFGAITDKIINKGIDIKAPEGAGVRASRSGKVVYRDQFLKGFGKTVILDHGDNYHTVYSYNSDILVNVGDQVAQNTVIAKVGRTGRAKDPTLHFEIRRDGEPQNPFYYLPR